MGDLLRERFDADGFVKLEAAVPADVAAKCAAITEIGPQIDAASAHREVVYATGRPGDVYLCHPFLVHAAQPHHGTRPRFMGQPVLLPAAPA